MCHCVRVSLCACVYVRTSIFIFHRVWVFIFFASFLVKKKINKIRGREAHEGEAEDTAINLWMYFSSQCYEDFDSSATGFYTVYQEAFNEIEELEQFNKETEERSPPFGGGESDYADVKLFYAYWNGFFSKLKNKTMQK